MRTHSQQTDAGEGLESKKSIIRHFLAALAYRAQKSVRGASGSFADFAAGKGVRTPHELVRHINGVLYYALVVARSGNSVFRGNLNTLTWEQEVERFHSLLAKIDSELMMNRRSSEELERLLQGPLSDAMTHIGQIALLRRLHGSPIRAENYYAADISKGRTGAEQPEALEPD